MSLKPELDERKNLQIMKRLATCGGRVKIIRAIEDSLAIKQILEFMRRQEKPAQSRINLLSPPPAELF